MRVAYIAQSYPPMISGAAIVVEALAQAMAARGHEVLVLAASDRGSTYRTDVERLSVVRLQSLHNPLRVRQRFLLCARRAAMKHLHAFQPELIHVHEPLQLAWLGLEYGRGADIPVLLTVHQTPSLAASYLPEWLSGPATSLLWRYARWLAGKFSAVVTPTQTISELVTRMTGVPVHTISSGIDLQSFRPSYSRAESIAARGKWKLPPDAPLLLHVGRLDAEKKVEKLIRAAVTPLEETPAHLVIVGDGSQKPVLMKLCKRLKIVDRVHFTGFVPACGGLPELYRVASLFVTASEIETQGIVLLEAAASGLPVVAVRASCIPEIVHEGVNGFLTEPGDIPGMGQAMTFLLKDPVRAEQLGRASRSLAGAHSSRSTLDAHELLYLEVAVRRQITRVPWSAVDAIL